SLQMVEHIFSGVEREQLKVVPKMFDDLAVKKALHEFLQISGDAHSPEHAHAEFKLMQETESWYSALSQRDKNFTASHLRRFCETTRPVLSSQALISLARFYRNAPFTESVRSKFDLVLTRLFSKEIDNDKRELLLSRDEVADQLKHLYEEWSSVPLYSAEEDDSGILLAVLKIEDCVAEACEAESFDELVKNDFFNRLRTVKESNYENFFSPLVAATVIEANIRIGNRYVELLEKEREKGNTENLEEKYGLLHDHAISETTGKTLELIELLKEKKERIEPKLAAKKAFVPKPVTTRPQSPKVEKDILTAAKVEKEVVEFPKFERRKKNYFGVNKWLLAATLLTIVLGVGFYFWGGLGDNGDLSTKVKRVNLENSSLKEFINTARISDQTFYGVVSASWNNLTQEKKEEILRKMLILGKEKGFSNVHLLDSQGKRVGFATPQKVEAVKPQ
ncbi:MAG TPA: hypothetical protein VK892_21295, partial [Pyrinomonadaceae bacterium]|nr:hypothetical protein [Pyrinomonadaceae bacterium]